MATEGQVAIGPNGERAVFTGGQWVVMPTQQGGPVTLPVSPMQAPQLQQVTNQAQASEFDPELKRLEALERQARLRELETKLQSGEIGLTQEQKAMRLKELNRTYRPEPMLQAIRSARRIAQEEGGTGWASLMSGVPSTTARKLKGELDTIFGNLSFDRLQQMREESTTGGALGAIAVRELELLGSTLASLDQGTDLNTFLDRLDRIERGFISAQLAGAGIDPTSDEGRQAFKQQFDYRGVFDDEVPEWQRNVAAPDATQTAVEIPPEYQAAHLRYLRDNWGNIDPQQYTVFRSRLDEQFGLTPNLDAYRAAVPSFNAAAQEGASPEQLGAVPAPPRDMSAIEQFINFAAQRPEGAFMANMGNAIGAGLPAYLGGEEQNLEAIRTLNPGFSTLGEIAGGIGGSLLAGGGAARAAAMLANPRAASLLANPLTSDVAFSGIYGATQDGAEGAGIGAGAALAGNRLGRAIGGVMPDVFAPTQYGAARQSVPSIDDLKQLAGQQYEAVERAGVVASPRDTGQLLQRMNAVLASEGRLTPAGRMVDEAAPVNRAMTLLQDYAGQPMSPTQAGAVRSVLGEGLASPEPSQRRIASILTDEFDKWADPVLPGVDVPRATSRRYIEGQKIQQAMDIAADRTSNFTQSGSENALRNAFRNLSVGELRGTQRFSPAVSGAIDEVVQGNTVGNIARRMGKLAPTGAIPIGASGILGSLGYAAGGPVGGVALGAGSALLGSASRAAATRQTELAAINALDTALGGQGYLDLIEQARRLAAARGGSIGAGGFGTSAIIANREF